jgi:outer membrane protein assembly factor BamB
MRLITSVFLVSTLALTLVASGDDWPQWLGPQRDGIYREEGIVNRFPEGGLPVKWRVPLDWGYSGPAVADGKVFVMDYECTEGNSNNNPGGRDRLQGTERIKCFDASDGSLILTHEYDRPYNLSFAGGPRCTPTVDGDRVYALGAEGNLWCLDVKDGRVIWSKDYVKDYGAKTAIWGVAAHPLIDGDRVYCVVGGEGSVAVAFNKLDGKELWRSLSANEPGYCPPSFIEHAGRRQLLIWHSDSVNALEPSSGKQIWTAPIKPNYAMAIAAPQKLGAQLFVSGYGQSALLKLNADGTNAEIVWRGKPKKAIFSGNVTPVLENDVAYGCDINTGMLAGMRLSDGERLWETLEPTAGGDRRVKYGTAFITRHKDRFFVFSETGDLILAKLAPDGYEEISRFHVLEPSNQVFGRAVVWSHPAYANKCMFARNDKELVCVDLAAQ